MEQVDTEQVVQEAALGDGAQDEASIAELLGEQAQAEQPVAEQTPATEPKPPKPITSQADYQNALANQRKADRRELRKDPVYQLGEKLISERMAGEKITREEAIQRISDDGITRKAAELKDNPEEMVKYLLRKLDQKNSEPSEPSQEADAFTAAQEVLATGDMSSDGVRTLAVAVRAAIEDGTLPDDFDPKTEATQAFFDDWREFGIKTAARILTRSRGSASNIDATKAQQRKDEPKPIRTTGENTGREPINVADMSDEEFKAFRRKLQTAADRRGTVR